VLAHDLLGPLAAAKMGMQLLHTHPELLSERTSVSAQIIHDLDRTDRMVRDLLDVRQIRAGRRPVSSDRTSSYATSVCQALAGTRSLGRCVPTQDFPRSAWSP
jgi:signal transduction histidine kinase